MPPFWRPGGLWDDPGTLGSTSKDSVKSRHGFYQFFADVWDPFREFFLGGTEKHTFFICISRLPFLMTFVSESRCLGVVENQEFGKGSIAKNNFRRNWICQNSRVIF